LKQSVGMDTRSSLPGSMRKPIRSSDIGRNTPLSNLLSIRSKRLLHIWFAGTGDKKNKKNENVGATTEIPIPGNQSHFPIPSSRRTFWRPCIARAISIKKRVSILIYQFSTKCTRCPPIRYISSGKHGPPSCHTMKENVRSVHPDEDMVL
jgi:hypothetical protein